MKIVLWILAALGFVAFVIGATFLSFHFYEAPKTAADFGNAFGAVNAVVSGLALLFVAFTLKQTQDELHSGQEQFEQQQKQLQQNTEALLAQKTELGRQVDVMVQQTFDTRFFQLLELLQGIVETIELPARPTQPQYRARAAFQQLYTKFVNTPEVQQIQPPPAPATPLEERRRFVAQKYRIFYDQHSNEIGHYYRTLYHIVRYVDESALTDAQKKFFIRLIRAQLSQHQQLILFYSSLTENIGYEKFYPLIERHKLLHNMSKVGLLLPDDIRLYPSLVEHNEAEPANAE